MGYRRREAASILRGNSRPYPCHLFNFLNERWAAVHYPHFPFLQNRRSHFLRAAHPVPRDILHYLPALLRAAEGCRLPAQRNPHLTQSPIKFPQPQHITSLLSQVTGNAHFFRERLEQLDAYFAEMSKITDLENSLGMTLLVQGAAKMETEGEGTVLPPAAPRICGRKLVERVVEE
jgi:hypothetical protein